MPARGPAALPQQPQPPGPSGVGAGLSRPPPRSFTGTSSMQFKLRRSSASGPGSAASGLGDGILPPPPPPPPRQGPNTSNPPASLTCFACHQSGHFQSRCLNPPFCLICRSEGHLTVECQNRVKPPTFVQFGTGLPGCLFFALDSDLPVVAAAPSLSNTAIVSVQGQKISPQTLLEGLRVRRHSRSHLLHPSWFC